MKQQIHESELLIPALKIINNNPGINTSQLKKELELIMDLYEKDKEILKNRNDNYFSQTVRNLCGSHLSTNEFGKCVTVEKIGSVNCFSINERGLRLINNIEDIEFEEIMEDESYQKEINNSSIYDNHTLKLVSNRRPQLSKLSGRTRYKIDPRIAKTVIANNNYMCEYAQILGTVHKTFSNKKGVQYQEGHHLIPIKAQKNIVVNIDRTENIVSLCPTCHRAIHNACKDEKLEILTKLYAKKIKDLKKCGIDITLEDLFNKYYI